MPQTIKDYKFEKLKQQAHDKKVSVLEFLMTLSLLMKLEGIM